MLEVLAQLPSKRQAALEQNEPYILGQFALKLADKVHRFIYNCRVLGSSKELERLLLVYSAKIVLRNTLYLLGIPIVEKM